MTECSDSNYITDIAVQLTHMIDNRLLLYRGLKKIVDSIALND